MKKTILNLSILVMLSLIAVACNKRSVARVDPSLGIDLSGRWNDIDSKIVAEEMSKDALARPWRSAFTDSHKKRPTVIVGIITNKSHEHIEAETFIKDVQRELINSGTVRVVQNSELREALRKERGDQQQFASQETQKKFGRELGADYMIFGTINSIVDTYENKKVVYYQVNLELADIESNEIVWIGEKKIKKFIKN